MSGGIFLASKMRLITKVVHIKFHFLTHSPAGIISLTVFLKALFQQPSLSHDSHMT